MQTLPANDGSANNQITLFQKKLALEAKIRNGINWFYWIAGLSFINTIIYVSGGSWNFIMGLGITQLIDGIVTGIIREIGPNGGILVRLVGIVFDLGIGGMFVGLGILGRKRIRWAVITGMVLYALDGLLFLWVREWLSFGFHAFALWGLWTGLSGINELDRLESNGPIVIPPGVLPARRPAARGLSGTSKTLIIIILLVILVPFLYAILTNFR